MIADCDSGGVAETEFFTIAAAGGENIARALYQGAHPGLVVDDLAALEETLKAAAHAFREDDRLPGYRRIFLDDPLGNRIEVMGRIESGDA